jgi:hypothetical protein
MDSDHREIAEIICKAWVGVRFVMDGECRMGCADFSGFRSETRSRGVAF